MHSCALEGIAAHMYWWGGVGGGVEWGGVGWGGGVIVMMMEDI
jgi:hypothetical protein